MSHFSTQDEAREENWNSSNSKSFGRPKLQLLHNPTFCCSNFLKCYNLLFFFHHRSFRFHWQTYLSAEAPIATEIQSTHTTPREYYRHGPKTKFEHHHMYINFHRGLKVAGMRKEMNRDAAKTRKKFF